MPELTSPLMPVVNYLITGLLLYAGLVGLLLTFLPENGMAHDWVRRILMPSALSVVAFICAAGVLFGGLVAALIAKRLL